MTTTPAVTISADLFAAVLAELARRGENRRESGAFLLATGDSTRQPGDPPRIVAAAYYDDLDPACLTGGITFTAAGYTALNAVCRARHLQVAADMHTHPSDWVGQSCTDAAHPMVALPGHIAIIVPRYATGAGTVEQLGVHVLGTDTTWQSYYGSDVADIVRVEARARGGMLRAAARWLARLVRPRTWRHR